MHRLLFLLCLPFFLTACAAPPTPEPLVEELPPHLSLTPASFSDLPGWDRDQGMQAALMAFAKHCPFIVKRDAAGDFGGKPLFGKTAQWQQVCRALELYDVARFNNAQAQQFITAHFTPFLVNNGEEGLITGYYEASLRGSPVQTGVYNTPLYARPDDLVMVDLGQFRNDLRGERIAGSVVNGRLRPYPDRGDIVSGALSTRAEPLVWVDDPVDAFFVQIQGSGLVEMVDGSQLRVGYAGQNGHIYTPIGRILINDYGIPKEEMSMQRIRRWLEENPGEADALMNQNRSYVFFEAKEQGGAIGAAGLPLMPRRSLAVDRTLWSYGAPVWLSAPHPVVNQPRLERLMIAEDTGGAIRGPVRGDFFWGHGMEAEQNAGLMKSYGQMWVLLPR